MTRADRPPTVSYASKRLPLVAQYEELSAVSGETRGWAQHYAYGHGSPVAGGPGIFVEIFRSPGLPKRVAQAMRNARKRRPVTQGTLYLWPATFLDADVTMAAIISNVDATLIVVRASDAFREDDVVEFVGSLGITWG